MNSKECGKQRYNASFASPWKNKNCVDILPELFLLAVVGIESKKIHKTPSLGHLPLYTSTWPPSPRHHNSSISTTQPGNWTPVKHKLHSRHLLQYQYQLNLLTNTSSTLLEYKGHLHSPSESSPSSAPTTAQTPSLTQTATPPAVYRQSQLQPLSQHQLQLQPLLQRQTKRNSPFRIDPFDQFFD
jgi:hypothetical protein